MIRQQPRGRALLPAIRAIMNRGIVTSGTVQSELAQQGIVLSRTRTFELLKEAQSIEAAERRQRPKPGAPTSAAPFVPAGWTHAEMARCLAGHVLGSLDQLAAIAGDETQPPAIRAKAAESRTQLALLASVEAPHLVEAIATATPTEPAPVVTH